MADCYDCGRPITGESFSVIRKSRTSPGAVRTDVCKKCRLGKRKERKHPQRDQD
jgi:hypothetical protein